MALWGLAGVGGLAAAPASLEPARAARPRARSREAPRYRGNESALRSPRAARVWWAMVMVGMLAFAAAAAGIAVSATHGTRTTADEPQYLLTAISLAEDRDLDIGDELADGRWRPFHTLPLPEQTEPLAGGRRLSPHDPLLPLLLAGPGAVGGWAGANPALAAGAGRRWSLRRWPGCWPPSPSGRRCAAWACRLARRPWPSGSLPAHHPWPSTAARSTPSSRRPWPCWRPWPRCCPQAGGRPWSWAGRWWPCPGWG